MAFAGRAFLLTAGCVRHTDGLLPDCVARFTRVMVDGAGYGVLRYWCWVSQFNRLCVFDWRRVNVLLRASG